MNWILPAESAALLLPRRCRGCLPAGRGMAPPCSLVCSLVTCGNGLKSKPDRFCFPKDEVKTTSHVLSKWRPRTEGREANQEAKIQTLYPALTTTIGPSLPSCVLYEFTIP